MKIIYISTACYKDNKAMIDKSAKIKLENNIIKFHNTIIEGLSEQNEITDIVSLIGLPISYKTNKKMIWKKTNNYGNNVNYIQFGFINIPILKQLIIQKKIKRFTKQYILKNKKDDIIIIYDASFVTTIPEIVKLSKKYGIRSIAIFADIYDYMFDVKRKSNKCSLIKKLFIRKLNKTYNSTYGYIFLTEEMNNLVNKKNKPYIVMEGIISENNCNEYVGEKYNNTILYAGGLYEKYGVKNLIEAINSIEDRDIKLELYGKGDLEEYIKTHSSKKIDYHGLIENEKILIEEKKSTILINPRFSNEEYTKYSFPSKIMEYMASGTPVLTTKLPGIPQEYYNYVYTIEDESVAGLRNAIINVIQKEKNELNNKGYKAQKFILDNKNNIVQCKRILDLIKIVKEEK